MLTAMRDKLSGWITWTIIIGISLVFLMFGIGNYFEDGAQEAHSVANVGNESITQLELTNAINRLAAQNTEINNTKLRKQALQALIDNKLQVVAAKNIGTGLSTNQLDQIIYQIPAFQENGKFSNDRFNYIVSRNGLSLNAIRNDIANNTLIKQVSYGIAGSTFILPSEVDNFVNLMSQKRDISQLNIHAEDFSKKTHVSKKNIDDYYKSHGSDFMNPAKVSLQYIALSIPEIEKKINPSEESIRQYYNQNKASFEKLASRKYSQITLSLPTNASKSVINNTIDKANKIISKASTGMKFTSLVQKFSTDLLAKKDDGNMGWINQNTNINQEIIKTTFQLKDIGDISQPVVTQHGVQIIKLTGIKAKELKTYQDAKPEIIKILKRQKAEMKYSAIGNSLSNLAFENPQSLKFVAKQLNLKLETTKKFTKKGLKQGITKNEKVLQAAFSNNVLKDKNNSDIINISNTKSVVIRINQYTPSEPKPLNEVSPKIEKLLIKQKELNLAKQQADEITIKLNKKISTEKLKLGNNFVTIKNISRENKKYSQATIQAYMSTPLSTKENPNYRVIKVDDGYAIYAVDKIITNSDSKNNEQKDLLFGQMMKQLYGNYIYQLYLAHIKQKIPVKIAN